MRSSLFWSFLTLAPTRSTLRGSRRAVACSRFRTPAYWQHLPLPPSSNDPGAARCSHPAARPTVASVGQRGRALDPDGPSLQILKMEGPGLKERERGVVTRLLRRRRPLCCCGKSRIAAKRRVGRIKFERRSGDPVTPSHLGQAFKLLEGSVLHSKG